MEMMTVDGSARGGHCTDGRGMFPAMRQALLRSELVVANGNMPTLLPTFAQMLKDQARLETPVEMIDQRIQEFPIAICISAFP